MSRDADCRALAAAMPGWRFINIDGIEPCFRVGATDDGRGRDFPIPAPDAPLGDRLRFVGELAEAMDPGTSAASKVLRINFVQGVIERWSDDDLAHAAILAALAAKGAT